FTTKAISGPIYRFARQQKEDESGRVVLKGETHPCVHRSHRTRAGLQQTQPPQPLTSLPKNVVAFWPGPWWAPSSNGTTFSSTHWQQTLCLPNYFSPRPANTTSASSRW